MRFLLPDGKEVSGRGYTDIIIAMNDEKFTPAKNLDNYRHALAERVIALYGTEIDTSSDKAMVTDLVSVGLLIRLP